MTEKPDVEIEEGLCPRLLGISFRSPPGRWVTYDPSTKLAFGQLSGGIPGGTIAGITLDGERLYPEETPLVVQPDLLVDFSRQTAVGLVFQMHHQAREIPRAKRMLGHLDSRAIRMSEHGVAVGGRPPRRNVYYDNPSLEVLWADSEDYEVVLGQFDYGMWSFLYDTSTPTLLDDGDDWSVPVGLITSLDDIHYPIEMSRSGFRDLEVRFV
jgi:hypothetical protein